MWGAGHGTGWRDSCQGMLSQAAEKLMKACRNVEEHRFSSLP